jgi:pyruvate,orthophosphate dikinase
MTNPRLRLFQAVRLKGRAKLEDLAAASGLSGDEAAPLLAELASDGYVERVGERVKLTAEGRAALDGELATERSAVDVAALTVGYHEFDEHNTTLKGLMTRWQLKDESTPNDHTDADYDARVIGDLSLLDADFRPLLSRFVELAPRLGHYPQRFSLALDRIASGDHSWFARPLADSYHTVWFELHEDLIGLAGLTRAEEAAAGRAL